MRRLSVAAGALGFAVLLIGLSLQLLLLPGFTRTIVTRVGSEALTGLSAAQTLVLAEEVRAYVASPVAPPLPADVDGREGFDDRQSSHLDDVRAVIRPAIALTWVLLAGALVWIVFAVRMRGVVLETLASALMFGGIALLVFIPLAGLAGLADFDRLFAEFHGVFFEGGTWQFYHSDLIIQLFPESFWVLAGASWAVLAVVLGAAAGLTGRILGRRDEAPQE